ncbi:Trimethyllysine dioxygenase, mitochondrial [Wickerhamomyces ciferrii]|uniref:Trimethyllysine dioxygenase, mitochondrial n=1 Tax=Wickerhamomyces ciferrii (strain ATCC 14091 / BCRC 22168 / CBS 111 / JCM 3599 / NBRC 0793 / NRRL Y-1031 F-60-10) TaxID=1206466 RepID=K0KSH8_WICCF|nr:Trimethyllysine dioxygenase, mitochondrial [Wickerhamomyces ciferrii]CCH44279.1 Trimethyllysine dioxygenase, mitochondrial [Wickerhamomyces ciferrii]
MSEFKVKEISKNNDVINIPDDLHPIDIKLSISSIDIQWSDKHSSTYDFNWLVKHTTELTKSIAIKEEGLLPKRIYWNNDLIKKQTPTVEYQDVLNKKSNDFYNNIYKYGFTFINNIPVSAESTEELCNSIGNIRYTHYGGFWDFTTDLAMKDTAYSDIEIPSHTDGTYWEYTPYLQLFHLLYHDGEGGNTTLVDAFQCAKIFQLEKPDEYQLLSNLKIDCHSLGDIYLVQTKPIFIHDDLGKLIQVSWNNSDRSSNFNMDNETKRKFYKAIKSWNEIIHREENFLWHRLKPGQALIFDNWRCLHSRIGKTTGKRRMCGCYFDKEDFLSNLKIRNSQNEQELFESL